MITAGERAELMQLRTENAALKNLLSIVKGKLRCKTIKDNSSQRSRDTKAGYNEAIVYIRSLISEYDSGVSRSHSVDPVPVGRDG